jgi:hypothetical protein
VADKGTPSLSFTSEQRETRHVRAFTPASKQPQDDIQYAFESRSIKTIIVNAVLVTLGSLALSACSFPRSHSVRSTTGRLCGPENIGGDWHHKRRVHYQNRVDDCLVRPSGPLTLLARYRDAKLCTNNAG